MPDRLILTSDDFKDDGDLFDQVGAGGGPGWGEGSGKGKSGASQVLFSPVLLGAIAGLIGGFLSWCAVEPFISDEAASALNPMLEMLILGLGIGGPIGLLLGATEGVGSGVWEKALKGALVGLLVGGAGGAFGSVVGQAAYTSLGGGEQGGNPATQLFVRALAWALVGLFVGLGQGLPGLSGKRILNGLTGGLLGGFLGGALFDPLAIVTGGGLMSRLIGFSVMGLLVGVAISAVEQAAKTFWLHVLAGPLAGKQFILYQHVTRLGSSPKADITLIKDPSVAPFHCELTIESGRCSLRDLGTGQPVLVNGQPVTSRSLRAGDLFGVGTYRLRFESRAAKQ